MASTTQTHPQTCCCSSCTGLQCLDRPRYFAGQLLTDADFTSEQDYVRAKGRLHNRYLHGSGIVCGLEVVCNACNSGMVTVQPGYAIDSCGNDIVVCESASFDVIQAIRDCCNGRKQRRATGCDPYEPPQNDGCSDSEVNWCIAIEYQEKESRGVMPLRNTSSCGCGGTGGGCGCGSSRSSQTPQCEPSRIRESYKLSVVQEPQSCSDPSQVTQGTLLGNLENCGAMIVNFYTQFPAQTAAILAALTAGSTPNGTPAAVRDACCRMRQALIALIKNNTFSIHCNLLADVPVCPPAATLSSLGIADYSATQKAVQQMNSILEQLLLDCICHALLPQCANDACDDRLILACVTVQNGRVVRICNFSCRRYAGSFPSLYYWLSAFPIASQIAAQFRQLCCDAGIVEQLDPAGTFRMAARSGSYAAPRMLSANLNTMLKKFSLQNVVSLAGPGAISLPSLVGLPTAQALDTLKKSNIQVVERDVQSASDVPAASTATGNLFASPGGTVVAYSMNQQVVAFAPYDLAQQLADTRAEVAALRAMITANGPS
ncbi:MAG TPA: hypothetical protein VKU01_09860 [Bryobacteraceae bacterium]|nr:hypothetical protein [Bryobacteraceae bacterium]